MTFPEKSTAKNLSDTPELAEWPSFCSSMAAGNMVTEKSKFFSGQGTDSEATHDVVAKDVDWVGSAQNAPELASTTSSDPEKDEKGSGYTPSPLSWKELH